MLNQRKKNETKRESKTTSPFTSMRTTTRRHLKKRMFCLPPVFMLMIVLILLFFTYNLLQISNTANNANTLSITTRSNRTIDTTSTGTKGDDSSLNILNQNCGIIDESGNADNGARTISCPCGKQTTPEYRSNMLDMYGISHGNGLHDMSKLKHCLDLTLPLKHTDPVECWPKMIILPSHATNGNSLIRSLLQNALNLLVMLDQYNEGKKGFNHKRNLYDMSTPQQKRMQISSPCDGLDGRQDTSLPLPIMSKPAIFKSHLHCAIDISGQTSKLLHGTQNQNAHIDGGGLHGIIRLARNPGDQIIRNTFRWNGEKIYCHQKSNTKKKKYKDKEECFLKNAFKFCDQVINTPRQQNTYINFHTFWNEFDENIPQIILHYERFSNLTLVVEAIEETMDFLNETRSDNGSDNDNRHKIDISKRIEGIVKEPKYAQGTIMAQVCGKEKARQLHHMTKTVTERLGYKFDNESATWSLS